MAHLPMIFIESLESKVMTYQELGLSSKVLKDVALATPAIYYFKINGIEYNFETLASINYLQLLSYLTSAISKPLEFDVKLIGGDIRIFKFTTTTIAITAGSTGVDLLGASGLNTSVDTAVANVHWVEHTVPAKRCILSQAHVNFPIAYTGDLIWEVFKQSGSDFNMRFSTTIASVPYYVKDIDLILGSQDRVRYYTESACVCGTLKVYFELVYQRSNF